MSLTVIGIDPGSRATGWGIVKEVSGSVRLVDCGIIRTIHKAQNPFSERLAIIYTSLIDVLSHYSPQEAAIEQVFTAQNVAAALKLGQARGVAVAACANYHLPVTDYAPTLIKNAIVGTGRAHKSQVSFMVQCILNVKAHWPQDTTDALAVALCHLNMRRFANLS